MNDDTQFYLAMTEQLTKEGMAPISALSRAGQRALGWVGQAGARALRDPAALRQSVKGALTGEGAQRWAGRLGTSAVTGTAGGALAASQAPEGDKKRAFLGGAILGGVAGLVPGQFVTGAGRRQAQRVAARQLHSVTGYMPTTAAQRAAGASRFSTKGWDPKQYMEALESMGVYTGKGVDTSKFGKGAIGRARKYMAESAQEAAQRGYTSVPGVVRGLAGPDRATAAKRMLTSGGALGTGMTAMMVPGIPQAYREGGAEGLGGAIGETAGWALGSAVPITGSMVMGSALRRVGSGVGRVVGGSRPGRAVEPGRGAALMRTGQVAQENLPPMPIARNVGGA